MYKSYYISIVFVFIFSGCSLFTRPLEKPVIEEKLNSSIFSDADVGTLSLTPERRIVLVNFANKRFCAEAPTEIGIDLSSLINATANVKTPEGIKAGIEAINAATSSNSILNKRTQGMQLFLANAYFLCQMYMNNAIEAEELIRLQLETLNSIGPLIENEIQFMYNEPKIQNTSYKQIDIDKLIETLTEERKRKDDLDKPK